MGVSRLSAARALRVPGPVASDGRILIGVRGLLEWAFAVECASLDFDEVGAIGPQGFGGMSATAGVCSMLELGDAPGIGVRVDSSRGHSDPHEDAELVVTVLRNAVPWSLAVRVAELARTCRAPRWDLGGPVVVPRGMGRGNQHGRRAATEVLEVIAYRSKRGIVRREVRCCPVDILPTASQIGAARRGYLDWYGALLAVRAALPVDRLLKFHVTTAMPPLTPWQENG